ncbi:MAG: hypothetical protein WC624_01100 [Candidatus Margulisiibacteriota bacterium]
MQTSKVIFTRIPITAPPANDNFGEKAPSLSPPVHLDSPFAISPAQWAIDTSHILASGYFDNTVQMLGMAGVHEFSVVNMAISLDNLNKSGGKVRTDDFLRLVCSGIEESFPFLSLTDIALNEDDPFYWFFRLGQAAELMKEVVFYDRSEWQAFCSLFLFNQLFREGFTKRFLLIPSEIGLDDIIREAKLNQDLFFYGEIAYVSTERIYFDVFYQLDMAKPEEIPAMIEKLYDRYSSDEGRLAVLKAALVDNRNKIAPFIIELTSRLGEVRAYELIEEMVGAESKLFFTEEDKPQPEEYPVSNHLTKILLDEQGSSPEASRIAQTVLNDDPIGIFFLVDAVLHNSERSIASLILNILKRADGRILTGMLWALSSDAYSGREIRTVELTWQVIYVLLNYLNTEAPNIDCSDPVLIQIDQCSNGARQKELKVPEPAQKWFEYELSKLFYSQIIKGHLKGQPARTEITEAVSATKILLDYTTDDYPVEYPPAHVAEKLPHGPSSGENRLQIVQNILRSEILSLVGGLFRDKGLLKYFPEILIFANLLKADDAEERTSMTLKVFNGDLRLWRQLLSFLGSRRFEDAYKLVGDIIKKAKELNPDYSEDDIVKALNSVAF